jgi:hypothetical protein
LRPSFCPASLTSTNPHTNCGASFSHEVLSLPLSLSPLWHAAFRVLEIAQRSHRRANATTLHSLYVLRCAGGILVALRMEAARFKTSGWLGPMLIATPAWGGKGENHRRPLSRRVPGPKVPARTHGRRGLALFADKGNQRRFVSPWVVIGAGWPLRMYIEKAVAKTPHTVPSLSSNAKLWKLSILRIFVCSVLSFVRNPFLANLASLFACPFLFYTCINRRLNNHSLNFRHAKCTPLHSLRP